MGNTTSLEHVETLFEKLGLTHVQIKIHKHSIENIKKHKPQQYVYDYNLSIKGDKGWDKVEIKLDIKLNVEKDNEGNWCIYNPFETSHPIRFQYKKNEQNGFLWYMNTMDEIESHLLTHIPYEQLNAYEVIHVIKAYIQNEKDLLYPNQ